MSLTGETFVVQEGYERYILPYRFRKHTEGRRLSPL